MTFLVAIELAIFLGFDGQLKQSSDLEMELFKTLIEQLKNTEMTKIENALLWVYVKSWHIFGQHVLDEESLWNFGGEDLEAALTDLFTSGFIYKNNVKTERVKAGFKTLLMAHF